MNRLASRWALGLVCSIALVACGAPSDVGEGDVRDGGTAADGAMAHDGRSDAVTNGDALESDANDIDVSDIDASESDVSESDSSALDAANMDAHADAMAHDAAMDASTCATGRTLCGATCVDTQTDVHNCGHCGAACATDFACTAGRCVPNTRCPALHFPSVTIQTWENASMTNVYRSIATSGCYALPTCFIDVDHLIDPDTGRSLDVHVNVSPHFELYEFVATEITMGYSRIVLVSPSLVSHMEALRVASGTSLSIASGYRSPQHQIATCRSICAGGAMCCPTASHPCGCRSTHEWGLAADLGISSGEYSHYGNLAHSVGFPECLIEAGSFHADVTTCSPLGCPYNF